MTSHDPFDVFLCHNSKNKSEVRVIRKSLEEQGIRCFLDESLDGGEPWRQSIASAMRNSRSVVIFIGSYGLGQYQRREIEYFDGNFFDEIKVIPVLLSNATEESIQTFHSDQKVNWIWRNQRVDFRLGGDPDPMGKLIQAIIQSTNSQNNQARTTQPKKTIDYLLSERGVDYTRLRDLLQAQQWEIADRNTFTVMLQAAGRQKEGYLNLNSIETFPRTDLHTIDQLWFKYSGGRFGFSVQKGIWDSVGGSSDAGYKIWCKFGDNVRWRRNKIGWCKLPGKHTYDINATEGHLPTFLLWGGDRQLCRLLEFLWIVSNKPFPISTWFWGGIYNFAVSRFSRYGLFVFLFFILLIVLVPLLLEFYRYFLSFSFSLPDFNLRTVPLFLALGIVFVQWYVFLLIDLPCFVLYSIGNILLRFKHYLKARLTACFFSVFEININHI